MNVLEQLCVLLPLFCTGTYHVDILSNRACVQSIPMLNETRIGVIHGFTASPFELRGIQSKEICETVHAFVVTEDHLLQQITGMWHESSCRIALEKTVYPHHVPSLILTLPANQTTLTLTRSQVRYASDSFLERVLDERTGTSKLKHTIKFASFPSFGCCGEGYVLEAPTMSSLCGFPITDVRFSRLYPFESVTIPAIPCVSDAVPFIATSEPTTPSPTDQIDQMLGTTTTVSTASMIITEVPLPSVYTTFAVIIAFFIVCLSVYMDLSWRDVGSTMNIHSKKQ